MASFQFGWIFCFFVFIFCFVLVWFFCWFFVVVFCLFDWLVFVLALFFGTVLVFFLNGHFALKILEHVSPGTGSPNAEPQ